jgi:hypothetical protein
LGTLFLDDVNDLPLYLQAKLLDVIQRGVVRPVGSDHEKTVDVRIIAACNQPLKPPAGSDFSFSPNVTGAVLGPGGSISMTVTFTPLLTGTRAATLSINPSGTNSPSIIGLSGTGRPPITKTGGGVIFTVPGGRPPILRQ